MEVSELKSYINRVLGNSLRCLLPSYWWKRLFGLMVDRIDEVEQKIDGIEIPDCVPIVNSESALNDLKLPNGSVASVKIDGYFSQCYLVSEADKGGGTETIQKLTRVRSIEFKEPTFDAGEVTMAVLIDVTAEKIISLYCGYGVPSGGMALCQLGRGEESVSFFLKTHIQQLNQILAEHDMRFYAASSDGMNPDNSEENLAILDKAFAINISSDAYIKEGSWEKLAKESDLEDVGGGTINANGVEIRELHISQLIENDTIIQENQLTDEQKAYNLETLELARQNKAIASISILNTRFLLYEYSGKGFAGSVLINTSHTLELYVAASIDDQGNGLMKLLTGHIDDELSDTSENAVQNKVVTAALKNKVDKVDGKQLSTEDFTSLLKARLEGLSNYDDTSIKDAINSLTTQINTLVSGDASVAIESFNEIIAFLNGIEDSESLDSIIAAIEQQIAGKQNTIDDLADIRAGAALGKTALQSVPAGYVTTTQLEQEVSNIESQISGVAATVPQRTSQLNNDSGFTTVEYVNTQVRTAIISALNTEV